MRLRLLALLLALTSGLSCTRYDILTEEVYEQAQYSNEVDILFVIDNSGSMEEEQNALSTNSSLFIQNLSSAALDERSFPHDTLYDAVHNYLYFLNNFNRYMHYRLAATTTELTADGQNGHLIPPWPDDAAAPLYISDVDADPIGAFIDVVASVQANPAVVGEEKGLDAVRRAVCMSLPDPENYDELARGDLEVGCHDVVTEGLQGANGEFLRDGVALAVIFVSDEGDFSSGLVEHHLEFLEALGRGFSLSAIVPTLPRDHADPTVSCNPEGSLASSIERYREAVEATNGLLIPICSDFAQALEDVSLLINNLLVRFKLEQVPQEESILVFVNGVEVPKSELEGWVYNPATNTIEFTGHSVPDYSATIEVYYRAVTATDPRTLPF